MMTMKDTIKKSDPQSGMIVMSNRKKGTLKDPKKKME